MNKSFSVDSIKVLSKVSAVASIIFSLSGCDVETTKKIDRFFDLLYSTRSPFPKSITPLKVARTDSGLAPNFGRAMYWLDNRHLIAFALESPERELVNDEGHRSFAAGLFIWDTVTNSARQHIHLAEAIPNLCYHQGHIYYVSGWSKSQNFIEKRFGKFGHEQIRKEKWRKEKPTNDDEFLNSLSCQLQSRSTILRPEHRGSENAIKFLRIGDGYIHIGRANKPNGDRIHTGNQNNHVQLIQGNSAPITLPITAKEMASATVHFSEYLNEYVISPRIPPNGNFHHYYWPSDLPMVTYFMTPEGRVRKEEFPTKPRVGSSVPYPTRQGYFFPGGVISTRSRDAGGWLYSNGKFIKLYDHVTTSSAISPDGCKAAITVSYDSNISNRQIQILDFCSH